MAAKDILKRFSKIFLKTLWICVVICGVFFLAFVGLILALKGATSEMAAWVQAIFSVVAIGAAGWFPIAHEERKEKRQRRNVLRTLGFLSDPIEKLLILQKAALLKIDAHHRWLNCESSRELLLFSRALNEIPSSMVVGIELSLLTDLRSAYEYAADIDAVLKVSAPGNLSALGVNMKYYAACERSIESILLVKETIEGLKK
ncbi:hypothetical protein [Pseudomonas viridiflava]|uniref:hypothetical protein n=1 Tax=Pseudomonas viridiflava TaxID=33069 RepID=UPI000F059D9C|nr:hypothetical protein [Pseudomonas viridiflava]